jgi:uncharacterized repeat protein (TIGR01451 family)
VKHAIHASPGSTSLSLVTAWQKGIAMHRRPVLAASVLAVAFVLASAIAPTVRAASAQVASSLTLSLTASTTKAKVGDLVSFTARVENTGTESVLDLFVNLGLPDALDARAIHCPGDADGSTTFCEIGDVAPGTIEEILFVVQVGAKKPIGPVTASAACQNLVLADATIPPLKIVGPPPR